MLPLKLIITDETRLKNKYGDSLKPLTDKIADMIKKDTERGFRTKLIFADDKALFKKTGVRPIKNISQREYKRIIDDLFKKMVPAYIMILGAQDIIPFQDLTNPTEDEDSAVPSDLPYACDTPYSRAVENFTGPTRVVGRVPDLVGKQTGFSYILKLLSIAASHEPYKQDDYYEYFAITANVWKKSTELNLQELFGNSKQLLRSPERKSLKSYTAYTKKQLAPKVHFYNCHGAESDLYYYGQWDENSDTPQALYSGDVSSRVTTGTIVAAECCYGAELIDSAANGQALPGIASNYLVQGAIGFLGSSTIAYGPPDSLGNADLITQYFIKELQSGCSTGRALLEARQKFLSASGPDLDPYELKTVAQFYLLGDPSVQPAASGEAETKTNTAGNMIMNSRKNLYVKGKSLESSIGKTKKTPKNLPVKHRKEVEKIRKEARFSGITEQATYRVRSKSTGGSTAFQKKIGAEDLVFRSFIKVVNQKNQPNLYKVLVIKENKSQVLAWRVYHSH